MDGHWERQIFQKVYMWPMSNVVICSNLQNITIVVWRTRCRVWLEIRADEFGRKCQFGTKRQ